MKKMTGQKIKLPPNFEYPSWWLKPPSGDGVRVQADGTLREGPPGTTDGAIWRPDDPAADPVIFHRGVEVSLTGDDGERHEGCFLSDGAELRLPRRIYLMALDEYPKKPILKVVPPSGDLS